MAGMSHWAKRIGGLALLGLTAPALAQEVMIEKATNGQDADSPPGPVLMAGDAVLWTYTVTNGTGRDLVDIAVSDDQGVTVTCPGTILGAGESFVCTGAGTAQTGQYANVGTVTAQMPDGSVVTDSDETSEY